MAEFASRGVGTAGLTTGIIGTGLAVLNGGLGNILGGNAGGGYVSKESFDLSMQLAESNSKLMLANADLNTEKKMVEVFNALNEKINKVVTDQTAVNAAQAVTNCGFNSAIAVAQNNINMLLGLTQMKIPNTSVCPGWGTVNVTPATTTTTA